MSLAESNVVLYWKYLPVRFKLLKLLAAEKFESEQLAKEHVLTSKVTFAPCRVKLFHVVFVLLESKTFDVYVPKVAFALVFKTTALAFALYKTLPYVPSSKAVWFVCWKTANPVGPILR